MGHVQIDETYLRILDLLQREGRIAITDLADRIDRAETTTRDRVRRLEHEGILQGYRARVDLPRLGYGTRGIVRADVDRRTVPKVAKALDDVPEVTHASLTTGPRPLAVELVGRELEDLERVLEERLSPLPLAETELEVVVREVVPRRPRPLDRSLESRTAIVAP